MRLAVAANLRAGSPQRPAALELIAVPAFPLWIVHQVNAFDIELCGARLDGGL